VLDATKVIPEEVLPARFIGRMVLDRWPDNFFAETEQVAYCPANSVPGIDLAMIHSPRPAIQLSRYAEEQARHGKLPPNPNKCTEMSRDEFSTRRANANAAAEGPGQLRAQ